ncbi:unnamed protein product [Parajaminaea phylloscopi]
MINAHQRVQAGSLDSTTPNKIEAKIQASAEGRITRTDPIRIEEIMADKVDLHTNRTDPTTAEAAKVDLTVPMAGLAMVKVDLTMAGKVDLGM